MGLVLQETCCSRQVLKPWKLDQETSEEKLFIKARQKLDKISTDNIYQGLMKKAWQIAQQKLNRNIYRDLQNQNFQIWFSAQADMYV